MSQSLSYDSRLLKNYRDSISKDAVVFITISYFSFFGIDEVDTEDFESKNKRYYTILPADFIKNYKISTDIAETFCSLYVAKEKLMTVLLGKSQDNSAVQWEWITNEENIEAGVEAAYSRHFVAGKLDDGGNLICNKEEITALYEMIAICREIGATPILITTPFLSEYTDKAQECAAESLSEFYRIIYQVIEDTDVKYYDYSIDERFKDEYSLFMNCDHLNKEGARVFTDILIEEVLASE